MTSELFCDAARDYILALASVLLLPLKLFYRLLLQLLLYLQPLLLYQLLNSSSAASIVTHYSKTSKNNTVTTIQLVSYQYLFHQQLPLILVVLVLNPQIASHSLRTSKQLSMKS